MPGFGDERIMRKTLHRLVWRLRYERPLREALLAYEDVFQELLAEMHDEQVPAHARLAIGFGWHPDMRVFDALAQRRGGRRSIVLHVACWSELQGMANTLFASNDQFTSIGSAAAEVRRFVDWFEAQDLGAEAAPACPIRKEAACLVAEIALTFIMLHEIAHHALGHLEDESPRSGLRQRNESLVHLGTVSPREAVRSQANEIEADRFAFSYLGLLASGGVPPFVKQLIAHPELRMSLFEIGMLAFALVMFFLRGLDRPIEYYASRTHPHPHPIIRFVAGISSLSQALPNTDSGRVKHALTDSLEFLKYSKDAADIAVLMDQRRSDIAAKVVELSQSVRGISCQAIYNFHKGEWVRRDLA